MLLLLKNVTEIKNLLKRIIPTSTSCLLLAQVSFYVIGV